MSGGKGGSQSAQVQIPQWAEDAARQNIARAQAVQNMPYAPIMGPTMAGFTSGQKAGMESQAALAQRMGIIPQSYDVASGYMPGEIDVGNGLTAYASYPGAKERVLAAFEENPALQRSYESLYANAPTYQEIRTADLMSQLPSNTLDALMASQGGDGDNTPSGGGFTVGDIQGFAQNDLGALAFLPGSILAQKIAQDYVNKQAKDPTSDYYNINQGIDGNTYTTSTGEERDISGLSAEARSGLSKTSFDSAYGFGD
jgi:hypothetical protein